MLNISEAGVNTIKRQADEAIKGLAEGKSVKDLTSGIYVSGLPNKTEQQGAMMADQVIRTVVSYGAECKAAVEDADGWMNGKLDSMLENKLPEERCQFLFDLVNALNAMNASALSEHMGGNGVTPEEISSRVNGMKLDPAAVTAGLEANLRARALEAMGNNSLFLGEADAMAEMLENCAKSGESVAQCVAEFGMKSADYKAIAAMLAYVAAKNGTVDGIPPDADINEITVGVCAAIEMQNIAAQVEEGSLTENAARLMIRILGMVAALHLIASLFLVGLAFGVGLSVSMGGLGLAAGLLLGIGVVALMAPVVIKLTNQLTGFVADVAVKGASLVVKGLRKLATWFTAHVLPGLTAALRRGVDFMNGLLDRGVALVAEEEKESVNAEA